MYSCMYIYVAPRAFFMGQEFGGLFKVSFTFKI